jgi:lipopolysaccharide export LptBFGC system permease protein LptF
MLSFLRPKALSRYVAREFARMFALSLLAWTMLFLLVFLFQLSSEWEEYGIRATQVAMLFVYLLPKVLAYSIPPSVMIAAILVFGRMSAENEILAAQAGGAPLRVLARPILLAAALLSGVSLWCTQGGIRWGFSTIRYEILQIGNPEKFFKKLQKEGSSFSVPLSGGATARINMLPHTKDPQGVTRKPVHIAMFKNQDVSQTIIAGDHEYNPLATNSQNDRVLTLKLRDMQLLGDTPVFAREVTQDLPLPPLDTIINIGDTRGSKGWLQNFNDGQTITASIELRRRHLLQRASDLGAMAVAGNPADPAAPALSGTAASNTRISSESIHNSGGARDRATSDFSEYHRKLALSLLPLSLALLGIGFGLLVRKSSRLVGFLLGTAVYALVYYPLVLVSRELALGGALGLWGLWLPNLLIAVIGYGLWRGIERGWLGAGDWGQSGFWKYARLFNVTLWWHWISKVMSLAWVAVSSLRDWSVRKLPHKTDVYMAGSFLAPLVCVLLGFALLITALDLAEHGPQVYEGLTKVPEEARKELGPGAPKRTALNPRAVLNAVVYYAIRSLEIICDLLPLLILLAGGLCVYTLAQNNELLIWKSSGVSLQRAFRPMMAIALLFSAVVMIVRETVLPKLIMRRDDLKALVYNKPPPSTALAMLTSDLEGRPVLFQMSQYSPQLRAGGNLRIYQIDGDYTQKRIPAIIADKAAWDGAQWVLQTDPNLKVETKKNATPKPLIEHGFLLTSDDGISPAETEKHGARTTLTPMPAWQGSVTPSLLQSDRLGAGVMSLEELRAAGAVKREYSVEVWRRLSEAVMALLLLWSAIPLLLKEHTRKPMTRIALCIFLGAIYWVLNLACAQAAADNMAPVWSPLIPHSLFFVFGLWHYHARMET